MEVKKALAKVGVVALVCSAIAIPATPPEPTEAATTRPNIVLVMNDDVPEKPNSLFTQQFRTPNLAQMYNQGVVFTNAHAPTPLCGPSRVSLLTGKLGHKTGMTNNKKLGRVNLNSFVNVKMQRRSYYTALIGKYPNGLRRSYPTLSAVRRGPAKGWNVFETFFHNQGRFYDYSWVTKNGVTQYGHSRKDHSTFVIAKRAKKAIREAPKNKPLFMTVFTVDGHVPRTPMPQFANHWSCRKIGVYRNPAFNEADVSDKPAYIRNKRKLGRTSFKLQRWCENVKGTDYVIGQVKKALANAGRLSNTLFITTSDHGTMFGDHRLVGKTYSYSTETFLMMRWPKVLGKNRRVVDEPVSLLDLAPTFCAIAGCKIWGADGMNILPLIKGKTDRVAGRKFISTEMLHPGPKYNWYTRGRPAWKSIITTKSFAPQIYRFVVNQKGKLKNPQLEFYNVTKDPNYLKNLYGTGVDSGIMAQVRKMLQNKLGKVRFRSGPA